MQINLINIVLYSTDIVVQAEGFKEILGIMEEKTATLEDTK